MAAIWFTGNYDDLSTDKGYQFKFRCEKCGNGYLSSFRTSALGVASSALQAAGNLFGGILGRAASSAYEIQRAVGGPAHDAALKEAPQEISRFADFAGTADRLVNPSTDSERDRQSVSHL